MTLDTPARVALGSVLSLNGHLQHRRLVDFLRTQANPLLRVNVAEVAEDAFTASRVRDHAEQASGELD